MDERECVKCFKAHLAALWYVRQVRDVASNQDQGAVPLRRSLRALIPLDASQVDPARHAGNLNHVAAWAEGK